MRWIAAFLVTGAGLASIKPNTSGARNIEIRTAQGGRLTAENVPLGLLISMAYGVKGFQVLGMPAWDKSERYDITAKPEGGSPRSRILPMLQSLLADRFKLVLHRETKEMPVYNLAAAKSGLKLTAKEGGCVERDPANPPPPPRPGQLPPIYCGNLRMGRGTINAFAIRMPVFVGALSDVFNRSIIDRTGFDGAFDVHLEFSPDEAIANEIVGGRDGVQVPPSADSTSPSIFTALQEQVGQRLESAKGPVEVLVIDHVEKPSEN